ncbi:MAG: LD-carboxypeptidase [Bacteroidales bacterium]
MPVKKIQPPFLAKGDKIAIISPSWAIEEDKINSAVIFLEKWGLKVQTGKYVCGRSGPFAGTDRERLSDLQQVTDDRDVKAVFCSRGGYGMQRIISKADFSALRMRPKWFVGFSDITVLHMWLSEVCGLISVHGEMPLNYSDPEKSDETFSTLHDALFGNPGSLEWEGKIIRPADTGGVVTGGNLSLICSLTGTPGEPETRGRILFIEEVGEYYYHFDRMLTSLKLAGKLKGLAALVAGGITRMEDTKTPWGRSVEDTLMDIVSGYRYPVFFNFPAGHTNDNRAFYIGKRAVIKTDGNKSVLTYI